MSFYDSTEGVESYVKMAEGYDGREIIDELAKHLPSGSTVLELGMGPGVDLEILSERYTVTGSDFSEPFLARYRQKNPGADLLQLDAVTMKTERRFNCIYSNKVLHHLTRDELEESLRQQVAKLNPGGLLCHTFWAGENEETIQGMRFVYYNEQALEAIMPDGCETLVMERYTEMEENDSVHWIARFAAESSAS